METSADSFYSPTLRDHALHPRNMGPLADATGHARITGPCGDTMEFWLRVRNSIVEKAAFTTDGCAYSQACGSVATCLAEGRSLAEAAAVSKRNVLEVLHCLPEEHEHCALLAANTLRAACADTKQTPSTSAGQELKTMRIAIPVADGRLATHFGHCESFALLDVDVDSRQVLKREDVAAPPHEPGLLPRWLAERQATVIIAGGMGQRAQDLFAQQGIQVVVGAPSETPEQLAGAFLAGALQAGANACDH